MTLPAKQQQILQTAKELFWKHGFKRVSVEEICRKSKVSKMTFYKYYPNKKELAKSALSLILGDSMKDYRELMAREISFADKIEEMLRLKFEGVKEVSEEFINDIYFGTEPDLKALYEAEAAKIMQEMMGNFVQAQQTGDMRSDISPTMIMYMMESMREQYFDPKLKALFPNPADLAMELNKFFFYGIGIKRTDT